MKLNDWRKPGSAEDGRVQATTPGTVEEHDMHGGWRVIVARHPDGEAARTWYFKPSEHPRHKDALRARAQEYLATLQHRKDYPDAARSLPSRT